MLNNETEIILVRVQFCNLHWSTSTPITGGIVCYEYSTAAYIYTAAYCTLHSCRLPNNEKKFEDIFIRFGATHECDRQTNRQSDGQTDRHRMAAIAALMHSIARQKSFLAITQQLIA